MNRFYLVAFLATVVVASVVGGEGAASSGRGYYDLRHQTVGERMIGPADVHFAGVNPLVNKWTVAASATTLPGLTATDIAGVLNPPAAAANANLAYITALNPLAGAPPTPTPSPGALEFQQISHEIITTVANPIRTVQEDQLALQSETDHLLQQEEFKSETAFTDETAFADYRRVVQTCILAPTVASPPTGDSCPKPTGVGFVVTLTKAVADADQLTIIWPTSVQKASSDLAGFADKFPTNYTNQIKELQDYITGLTALQATVVTAFQPYRTLRLNDFAYIGSVSCAHLLFTGKEEKSVVTIASGDNDDVTVDCYAPVFLTVGLGVDTIDNRSYVNVVPNTAGMPTPAAGATPPPGFIDATNMGVRFMPLTLLNFPLGMPNDDGNGFAFSVGAGPVTNNGGGSKVDYIGGVSFYFRRAYGLTLGAAFGQKSVLESGFPLGGQIGAGQTPPVKTQGDMGVFFGLTFGVTK